jgi:hypothetical protein
MITEEPEIFYKLYPYEYWISKANMLKSKIDNGDSAYDDIGMGAYGSDPDRYQKMLKYELHFTYFQQVEALFELLFALQTLEDKYIWFNLSDANGRESYGKINEIAEGELDLNDQDVELKNGQTLPFLVWSLYLCYPEDLSKKSITKSIEKTKRLLTLAAKDFADRSAYNAYKHGMRVLPMLDSFSFSDSESKEKLVSFDLSNSYSYLDIQKDEGFYKEITTTYSVEQDLFKIQVMTLIMANIIESRKAKFYDEDTIKVNTFADIDLVEKVNNKHHPNRIELKVDLNNQE